MQRYGRLPVVSDARIAYLIAGQKAARYGRFLYLAAFPPPTWVISMVFVGRDAVMAAWRATAGAWRVLCWW